jgi:DNA-binding Lrp family transcriptional regulator
VSRNIPPVPGKILRVMEEEFTRHGKQDWSMAELAQRLEIDSAVVRAAVRGLEQQGWLIRVGGATVKLEPIRLKLAGCLKVYKDGSTGMNIRCTTKQFHAEHTQRGFSEVASPDNVVGERH